MTTKVEEARAEVLLELDVLAPEQDGLSELELIRVLPSTHTFIEAEHSAYEHRITLEQEFVAAATALLANGYPGLPTYAIDGASYANLSAKVSHMQAALKKFSPNALTSLGSEVSAVVKK